MSLFSTSAMGQTNSWAKLALQDLAAIKTELLESHPGAVDRENPKFAQWMREGYIKASLLAKTANSFEGYYFALRRYTDGFNDKHLWVVPSDDVKRENNFWPGFAVSLNNDRFIVSDLGDLELNNVVKGKLPQPGDVLIACDRTSALELFSRNVLPFYGVEGLAADNRIFAPFLMFDQGNPYIQRPTRCTFENKSGKQYNINLNWQILTFDQIWSIARFVVRGKRPKIDFKQIESGVFWITLSNFAPNELETKQLKDVIKAAKKNREALRSSKLIVFDVRWNTGGDSTWGENLLESIWGEGFVERLPGHGYEAVDWRASTDNIKWIEAETRPRLASIWGEDSDFVRYYDDIIVKMKQAHLRDEQYYRESGHQVSDEKAIRSEEIAPKIYLLSDGACGSACLHLADWVLSIPNAELIGTETSADTKHMEIRPIILPSNKALLGLSMIAYRGRLRGSNESYKPKHRWNGNSWDTEALQDWVLKLSRFCHSPKTNVKSKC